MNEKERKEEKTLKESELKLISELMKNSRKSDRLLAKAVGASQSTVNRTIKKLEKEGYIKEYTLIPSFRKLGYQIMAFTFIKIKKGAADREATDAGKVAQGKIKGGNPEIIMHETGIGMGCTDVVVSMHKDYAAFSRFTRDMKESVPVERSCESFLINLNDETSYRHLTFSTLANHLTKTKEET